MAHSLAGLRLIPRKDSGGRVAVCQLKADELANLLRDRERSKVSGL